jgi:lipopolysaccharide export LptBFGC system permease protein LptF
LDCSFLACLSLWSIVKEDDLEVKSSTTTTGIQSEYSVRKVDLNTINHNRAATNALKAFKEKKHYVNKQDSSNKIVTYETLNVLVDDSEAKYLEKNDGTYHSYTFKAIDMGATDERKNLVLSLKDDDTYRVILMNYYLTPDDFNLYESTGYLHLDTKVNLTVVDSNTFSINLYSKVIAPDSSGGSGCFSFDVTAGSNCTAGGNHEYGDTTCTGVQDNRQHLPFI